MSTENMRDIHEILASIEALNEKAVRLNGVNEHQDNKPEHDSLHTPLVDEMGACKADIVLLDDVYRKGTSQQMRKADFPVKGEQQKIKAQPAPRLKPNPSDAEFDQLLSTLMKDVEHQTKNSGTAPMPRMSATGQTETRESNDSSNSKGDVEELLSSHLNTSAAPSVPQQMTASKSQFHQKSEKQSKPNQRDRQQDPSGVPLLSTIMSDEMRVEIADYILAEIKQQISDWIAENLENIVEDALRSVSTEARDALKARSVS